MHRIDTKTAQKDKFGAGKNGFTRGNPQTGTPATDLDDDYFDMLQEELCSVVEASGASLEKGRHDQLLTALRALLLSRKNPFADIKADGPAAISEALENLQLRESFSGVVGQSRNARMSVAAASATATFSADELIVEDSGGHQYRVTSFSGTINIATTGINGMDTGSAPVNGYVAIYAIYNPTTQTTALLAVDNSTTVATEVYTGSHMPAGYTASALISVWPTSSSQLVVGNQLGRKVHIPGTVIVSTTCSVTSSDAVVGSFTTGLISPNARSIDGNCYILANAGQQAEVSLLSVPVPGTGSRFVVNAIATQAYGVTMQFEDNPVYQSQASLIYAFSTSGATFNYSITMKGYTF